MTKREKTLDELHATAARNGLRIRFSFGDGLWTATGPRGRVLWCGKLSEIRRVAAGKELKP